MIQQVRREGKFPSVQGFPASVVKFSLRGLESVNLDAYFVRQRPDLGIG